MSPSIPSTLVSGPDLPLRRQLLLSMATGLVLALLPGCRGASSVQVDVLEQELRQQEDYIYELEDYLVEYSEKLRQARCTHDKQSTQAKSPTQPIVSEKILDDDDLTDEDLNRVDLNDQPESPPIKATPIPPEETEEIHEPDVPPRTTLPADTQQPPTANDLDDLEVPELKIEEPSATHPSRPSLPWSITDSELITSSAEEFATFGGPLEIPDPVNYRPPMEETSQVQSEFYEEQTTEVTYESNSPETGSPPTNRRTADVVSNVPEEEETTAINRIVIQQLLQNSPAETNLIEETLSPAESSYSSPQSTTPPRNLLAVVEIRDLDNEPVEADGNLSLMVMAVSYSRSDSSGLHGSKPRRLRRWDFSAEEVRQAWQSSPLGDGLHLELPMDAQPLANENLELWARLVTIDGQKHLTKLPFDPQHLIALPDALLKKSEHEPEHGASLLPDSVARQGENTIQKSTSWPPETKTTDRRAHANNHLQSTHHQTTAATARWRTAQIQTMPTGAATSHSTTAAGGPPRWVAQSQSVQSAGRRLKTSQTNRRTATIIPSTASAQRSASGTPTWKSIR